eukprot:4683227-Heterocapsa_arctica.AAC.1
MLSNRNRNSLQSSARRCDRRTLEVSRLLVDRQGAPPLRPALQAGPGRAAQRRQKGSPPQSPRNSRSRQRACNQ